MQHARFCGRARLIAFAKKEKTNALQNRIDGTSGEYMFYILFVVVSIFLERIGEGMSSTSRGPGKIWQCDEM